MRTRVRIPKVEHGQLINRRQVNYLLYPSGCVLNNRDRDARLRHLIDELKDDGFNAIHQVDGSLRIEREIR